MPTALRRSEKNAIRLLADEIILEHALSAQVVSVEHTGVGYFLILRHPAFPRKRIVYQVPSIVGRSSEGIPCGLVVGPSSRLRVDLGRVSMNPVP